MQADLVVLGNKGSTNLRYVLLGSTVERLLREVPCSVLVARPPAGDAAARGVERPILIPELQITNPLTFKTMNKLNTIIVGVDFSECSRCALEQAVRLARWNNAGLNVIHVMDSSALDNAMTRLPPELDELRRINREHAIGRLATGGTEPVT